MKRIAAALCALALVLTLALGGCAEKAAGGTPSFQVGGKALTLGMTIEEVEAALGGTMTPGSAPADGLEAYSWESLKFYFQQQEEGPSLSHIHWMETLDAGAGDIVGPCGISLGDGPEALSDYANSDGSYIGTGYMKADAPVDENGRGSVFLFFDAEGAPFTPEEAEMGSSVIYMPPEGESYFVLSYDFYEGAVSYISLDQAGG